MKKRLAATEIWFLLRNVENNMNRTCEKWGSSKENRNYKEIADNNQKETWNFGNNEEGKLGRFNTHRVH